MKLIRISIIATALVFGAPLAQAQEAAPIHPALTDKFYLAVGAFFAKSTTSAELNSSTLGAGSNIDFERALGITTQKAVPNVFARWRTSERWRIDAEYFQLNRSGSNTLDQDIQWGDKVFPAGTTVA